MPSWSNICPARDFHNFTDDSPHMTTAAIKVTVHGINKVDIMLLTSNPIPTRMVCADQIPAKYTVRYEIVPYIGPMLGDWLK